MFWFRDVYMDVSDYAMDVTALDKLESKVVVARLMDFQSFLAARPTYHVDAANWRRWLAHLVFAISSVTENNLKTIVDWILDTHSVENDVMIGMLEELLRREHVSVIPQLTVEQIRALAMGCTSDDSAKPPDAAPSRLTVHLFGDGTINLRSQRDRNYNFMQDLGDSLTDTYENSQF